MNIPIVTTLAIGMFALSSCSEEDAFPKSTPASVPDGTEEVHTPVVGMTTVTKKTEADNPY